MGSETTLHRVDTSMPGAMAWGLAGTTRPVMVIVDRWRKADRSFSQFFSRWVKLAYKALYRNGAQVQRVEGWGTVSQDRKRYRFKKRKTLFRPTEKRLTLVFLSDSEQSCRAIWTAITGQRKLQCRGNLSKTNHCNLPKWFASKIFHISSSVFVICSLDVGAGLVWV